ncbi:hypothetical protein [Streptomyces hokutonensis]|uniref:hypothetical protein n=1 Tax=Streptomyces hokutonensis TaxID=1306990 RepID=UPI0036C5B833
MAALLLAFQLNAPGATTDRSSDGGDHMPSAANVTATATASAKPGDDTRGEGDHAGKPGDNK